MWQKKIQNLLYRKVRWCSKGAILEILRPTTDCDLSYTAIIYGIKLANENDLGILTKLLICPELNEYIEDKENIKIKEMLDIEFPTLKREKAIWLSKFSWMLVFERGCFVSCRL